MGTLCMRLTDQRFHRPSRDRTIGRAMDRFRFSFFNGCRCLPSVCAFHVSFSLFAQYVINVCYTRRGASPMRIFMCPFLFSHSISSTCYTHRGACPCFPSFSASMPLFQCT